MSPMLGVLATLLSSALEPTSASAQAPIILQPVPEPPPVGSGPIMGPPVVVMPGQPSVIVTPPTPPETMVVVGGGVSVPVCPAGVPCPPPCPPGAFCPPPPCACASERIVVVQPPPSEVIVEGQGVVTTSAPVEVAPSEPAPGTFALGYLGTFDGTDVLHGAALRFTGHLEDVWFLEVILGGQGAATSFRNIGEGVFLIGPRVAAPIVTPNLRLYASLDTGILIRSIGNMQTWGIWPISLGGGLEFGGEIDTSWSIGGYVDVRAEARVPFERESASIGLVWSGGLAFLWF
ncbi:MAG: hypothetical protein K1X94_22120 [Sandaracinaceae bacterium]|nr:hypothetical protein [Sandaracinaceae bacterium]